MGLPEIRKYALEHAAALSAFFVLSFIVSWIYTYSGCPDSDSLIFLIGTLVCSLIAAPIIFGTKYGWVKAVALFIFMILIAIGLIFMIPGPDRCLGPDDAKSTQHDAYWRGEARPFAIVEHSQFGQTLYMVLQNKDAEQKSINSITVVGQGSNAKYTPTNPFYSAGEKKIVNVTMGNCKSGSRYEYWVNISYNNSDNSIQNQVGAKSLWGMCA